MQDLIEQALIRLGYDQDWFDLGIVSESLLLQQMQEITNSKDNYAEHYRYRAFVTYLDQQSELSDLQIRKIMQLVDCGPESDDLHDQRILSLLYSGLLTELQFSQLNQYQSLLTDPIKKIYQRTKLIRAIKTKGLAAVFSEVQASIDSEIHRFSLSRKGINQDQLQWFSTYGCNRSVRNMANNLLK